MSSDVSIIEGKLYSDSDCKAAFITEMNKYALRKLRPQIEANHIEVGYSNSHTCEIGLETNTGIPYMNIVYLVNECTTAKK